MERGKKRDMNSQGAQELTERERERERERDLLGMMNRRRKVIYFGYVLKVRRIVWNPKPSYI